MDWKLENIPSFVFHTFHLIYLAQEGVIFFVLHPRYLFIFHGLDKMAFRGNYKFENRAGSTALIFKKEYFFLSQKFRPKSGL